MKAYQNKWNTVNTVFRGKFIAVSVHTKKEKRLQNNHVPS